MNVQRVASALVMAPTVVAMMLFLPTPYVAAIAAALFLGGLWEWSRLVGIQGRPWRAAYLLANLGLMTGLLWARAFPSLFNPVALVGVVWWLFAVLWLVFADFGRGGGWWSRAVKLAAGTLAIVPAWCAIVLLHYGSSTASHVDPRGPHWALLGLAMVWAADSCAYYFGSHWGKRKLAPQISPGKTWLGLWGGVAGALALGLACAPWVGLKGTQWVPMAELILATVVASVVGDLFESLMKRHSGMKDSGTLIPGHGGVLDRIDSLLAALPVLWIAKGWLEL
ncbi:MAG TPA: phosphatidate cytidylyltransferase [Xanthomonadaceae bacterium]|jgi:phosphatidate cytidylyltransferase